MSPRSIATLVVVALLVSTCAGACGWNAWKTHRMEQIPSGASKKDVVDALGKPDSIGMGGLFGGCPGVATQECWSWKLIGNEYLSVCFDNAGKVACHDSFTLWV